MPKFGSASLKQRATIHPDLQLVLDEAILIMDFTIVEGYRGKVDQHEYFLIGASQKDWPDGEHNKKPSIAVDVAPYPIDWGDSAVNLQRFVLLAGIIIAVGFQHGIIIRWGGDWNMDMDTRDEHFRDYGHFEKSVLKK